MRYVRTPRQKREWREKALERQKQAEELKRRCPHNRHGSEHVSGYPDWRAGLVRCMYCGEVMPWGVAT